MKTITNSLFALSLFGLTFFSQTALADVYDDAIATFKASEAPSPFFKNSYGYAIFPTVGKVGFVIGGAYGEGKVYKRHQATGTTELVQGSIGFQMGAQAYSQVVFFEDQRAYEEFTSGNFEFSAQANAVVLTAGVSAETGTKGSSVTASGGQNNAVTQAQYYKGMATFIIAKGGLMYEASVGGQTFTFQPLAQEE